MSLMGERIYSKRMEHDLTMRELADLIGVQASAINKWEKGHVTNIKRENLEKMAKVLHCNPGWLMGYERR